MKMKPILIVMRFEDMELIHPDQIERKCNRCGHTVGIYPSGQSVLKRYPAMEIVCQVCKPETDINILAPGAEFEPAQSKPKGGGK
jgi:hypothetical protein